jgi:hypothetical protein
MFESHELKTMHDKLDRFDDNGFEQLMGNYNLLIFLQLVKIIL